MAEQAAYRATDNMVQITTAATIAAGEVKQLPDGRAGVALGLGSSASGDIRAFAVTGQFNIVKSTTWVAVPGAIADWDDTNNQATYAGGGDFRLGIVVADATAAATVAAIDLNGRGNAKISSESGWITSTVLTAGTPSATFEGGTLVGKFSATAEAQKAEFLSDESIVVADGPIMEAQVTIADNGDHAALDANVGLANAGHDTDADSITESIFLHYDGNDLVISAESDDGTTEVAATDTTIAHVEDTFHHILIDCRTIADCQIYIDGVLALGASVFNLAAATGPLKALVHMEKTSNDTPGEIRVKGLRVWSSKAA